MDGDWVGWVESGWNRVRNEDGDNKFSPCSSVLSSTVMFGVASAK